MALTVFPDGTHGLDTGASPNKVLPNRHPARNRTLRRQFNTESREILARSEPQFPALSAIASCQESRPLCPQRILSRLHHLNRKSALVIGYRRIVDSGLQPDERL